MCKAQVYRVRNVTVDQLDCCTRCSQLLAPFTHVTLDTACGVRPSAGRVDLSMLHVYAVLLSSCTLWLHGQVHHKTHVTHVGSLGHSASSSPHASLLRRLLSLSFFSCLRFSRFSFFSRFLRLRLRRSSESSLSLSLE